MADINCLPKDVLLRIFEFYQLSVSQQNLVNCLSKVCRKWEEACNDSSIFQSVDGSIATKQLIKLAKAGSLKKTKSLKFGIHKKSTRQNSAFDKHFKNFYANLPQLKSLNLGNVCEDFDKKKEHSIFTELKDFCPNLCELIVGDKEKQCEAKISYSIFEEFLHVRGAKLVTLDFSFVNIPQIAKVVLLIANHCPNLEDLLIQDLVLNDTKCIFFPVEQLQIGCPKLQVLRLTKPFIFHEKPSPEMPGFPQLQVFTYPYADNRDFKDSSFLGLLSKSPDLKVLDIRGIQNVSVEAVHSLPATNLEQLHISNSGITKDLEMATLLQKWSHSFRGIDLSYTTKDFLNEVLGPSCLPHGLPKLEFLDVSSSVLKIHTLKYILQHSPYLTFLDLKLCRSLERRTRGTYRSINEIKELLKKLEEIDSDA